jgi:hypothetical protein
MHRWTFVIVVALFSLVAGDAGAQTQKRVALVIGNSAYERAPALAPSVSGNVKQVPQYDWLRESGHDAGDFVFVQAAPATASK